ncbi:bromodomain-containing protein 8-like [Saccoglossus kowalevskii]|uniref:Bromodomain-containing protein 8-like n=1 Tax=Saccoglossus kowalevskii TaxID=10224 RepID=A0ABM0MLX7_SACKO|nr:PREDICTED: bromodomain-containing protein 8-like [Saccoglossus kowalevskii]
MAAVQRTLLKSAPTDKWSVRERLCLGSSVLRSGDQNWVSVSRAIKPFGEPNRPADWFSQKNCASQYSEMLETVETPKRKRSSDRGEVETPGDLIVRKLTAERIEELKQQIEEDQREYRKTKAQIEKIRRGESDHSLKQIWEEVQAQKKASEEAVEAMRLASEAKAAANAAKPPGRPVAQPPNKSRKRVQNLRGRQQSSSQGSGTDERGESDSGTDTPTEVLTPEAVVSSEMPQNKEVTCSHNNPFTKTAPPSPLLSSLLKDRHQSLVLQQGLTSLKEPIESTLPKHQLEMPSADVSSAQTPSPLTPSPVVPTSPCSGAPTLSKLLNSPKTISSLSIPNTNTVHVVGGDSVKPSIIEPTSKETRRSIELVSIPSIEIQDEASVDSVKEEIPSNPLSDEKPSESTELLVNADSSRSVDKSASETSKEAAVTSISAASDTNKESGMTRIGAAVETSVGAAVETSTTSVGAAVETSTTSATMETTGKTLEVDLDKMLAENKKRDNIAVCEPDKCTEKMIDTQTPVKEAEPVENKSSVSLNVDDEVSFKEGPSSPSSSTSSARPEDNRSARRRGGAKARTAGSRQSARVRNREKQEDENENESAEKPVKKDETSEGGSIDGRKEEDRSEADESECNEVGGAGGDSGDEGSSTAASTKPPQQFSFYSDSVPSSPASFSQGDDPEAIQAQKAWKKSIMMVWRATASHKYANVFLHPVTDELAPGYHSIVYRPMDLSTIKKNIETGGIRTTSEFQRDIMLMFQNAIMYNNSDHDVYHMGIEMHRDVMEHIQVLTYILLVLCQICLAGC